ncbi:hypothetical protein L0F63_006977, partial [Massospora cicadina]
FGGSRGPDSESHDSQKQGSGGWGYGQGQGSESQGYGGSSGGYGENSRRSRRDSYGQNYEPRDYNSEARNREGNNRKLGSQSQGYGREPRGYENTREPASEVRSYGHGSQNQDSGPRGYGSESLGQTRSDYRTYGDFRGRGSETRGYDGNTLENASEPRGFKPDPKKYGTSSQRRTFDSQEYGSEHPEYGHRSGEASESKGYAADSYKPRSDSQGYGSTLEEDDFTFEDKLFVNCAQKFSPDAMCQFLKSFGAISVKTDQEDALVSTARIQFKTKADAERAFAIWHSKFSLPFQSRMVFSRTLNSQRKEKKPAAPRLAVLGFPQGIDELTVYELFRGVGPIYSCSVMYDSRAKDPPCALLQFVKDESNDQAISRFHGSQFQGETLAVELADEAKLRDYVGRSRAPVEANESYVVEVSGIPSGVGRARLLQIFKSAGEIIDLEFDGSSDKCTINYDTAMGAFGAISRFNNYRMEGGCLTVTSGSGRPAPKPFASIPLSGPAQPAAPTAAIPFSRDASQSRWNQKSDAPSGRPRRNPPSSSNEGSQYGGELPSDPFGSAGFLRDQDSGRPLSSDRIQGFPVPQSVSIQDAFQDAQLAKSTWDAPIVESKASSWEAQVAEPKITDQESWEAQATKPEVNNQATWTASVNDSRVEVKPSGWEAPIAEPKPTSWEAPIVEPKPTSWEAPIAEPKPSSWDAPLPLEQKPEEGQVQNKSQQFLKKEGDAPSKQPRQGLPQGSEPQGYQPDTLPGQMNLAEFLCSELRAPFYKLLKGLSPASDRALDLMVAGLFQMAPEKTVKLAALVREFEVQIKNVEAAIQEQHQFSISDEAYERIKKVAAEKEAATCNPEFLPLYPAKEQVLQALMMAPEEQSRPALISLLAKRLAHFEVPGALAVATAISERCSLRLMMVAYCYDNVLQDLQEACLKKSTS